MQTTSYQEELRCSSRQRTRHKANQVRGCTEWRVGDHCTIIRTTHHASRTTHHASAFGSKQLDQCRARRWQRSPLPHTPRIRAAVVATV